MDIAVTGIGIVTPFGVGKEINWKSLHEGKCAYKRHTVIDEDYKIQEATYIAGLCEDPVLDEKYFPLFKQDKLSKVTKISMLAAEEALEESEVLSAYDADMVSIFLGVTNEAVTDIAKESWKSGFNGGRISPTWFPNNMSNAAGSYICEKFGIKGASFSVNSACASASHSFLIGIQSLESGRSDAVLVGGSEGSCTPALYNGFKSIRAAVKDVGQEIVSDSVRPFDLKRKGLVVGEGSCIMVLERLDKAIEREAVIHAIIPGIGASSNATHITNPCENGTAASMRKALKDANMKPEDIDYLNAHGTATKLGDIAETNAIKDVFGEAAYDLTISSTKSMTGHCLAAGGAIEAFASIQALKTGIIPPTTNLDFPDPKCDLNFTPNKAIKKDIEVAMSNSLGFGGANCTMVFKKYKI